jgi:hypothetical protein
MPHWSGEPARWNVLEPQRFDDALILVEATLSMSISFRANGNFT